MKEILTIYGEKRTEVGISDWGLGRTKQSFQDDSDVNLIVAKYMKTGLLPQSMQSPRYGDFSKVQDYQGSLNAVMSAQQAFDDLPAKIRERFSNDPGALLEFISNKDNKEEAIKLGLIESIPTPDVAPVPAAAGGALSLKDEVEKAQ